MQYNQYHQPIGHSVENFTAGKMPSETLVKGHYCRLEKLDPKKHFEDLWEVYGADSDLKYWTYLPKSYGRFEDKETFTHFLNQQATAQDPYVFAIIDPSRNKVIGTFSLMRIDPNNRVIEVGAVIFGDELKRSRIATEAHYLLACYVFEVLQYRRYEWKCDSLNAPSRRSAERLGFTFEGIFRQAQVYHDRNRDTAWYSMLDCEWQAIKKRFESWLASSNFDENGQQKKRLQDC